MLNSSLGQETNAVNLEYVVLSDIPKTTCFSKTQEIKDKQNNNKNPLSESLKTHQWIKGISKQFTGKEMEIIFKGSKMLNLIQ